MSQKAEHYRDKGDKPDKEEIARAEKESVYEREAKPREVYPPDPPEDPFPTEKAVVFGDASATYGSMVAPEVIRPASQLPVTGPLKKEKKEEDPKTEELKEELEHRHEEEHEAFKRVEKHKRDHR